MNTIEGIIEGKKVLVSWSRDEYYRRYYRREEGVS